MSDVNNLTIKISIASNRQSKHWQAVQMTWRAYCEKLQTPIRGDETLAEFMKLPKTQQDDLKDVGGFVGGAFSGADRRLIHLEQRSLITLDLDNIPVRETQTVLDKVASLRLAAVVYSTRKHSSRAPRLRVVVPFAEPVEPDRYEPCARMLASQIGIDYCDPTTFEGNRLMFWPSCSMDSDYVYQVFSGDAVSADQLLSQYQNWSDYSEWPTLSTEGTRIKRLLTKQQDPLQKKGIVGAFCRAYTIREAMDTFLPGLYEPGSQEDRFTYTGGSTANGALIYDEDRFLFSHHATDPCSNQLVNAWDLVRLHLFSDLDVDSKPNTPANRLPSFHKMVELAKLDQKVNAQQKQDYANTLQEAFGQPVAMDSTDADQSADTIWIQQFVLTETGAPKRTINNVVLILRHDPLLKGRPALNEFANRLVATGPLPWDTPDVLALWDHTVSKGPAGKAKRDWTDTDTANLTNYVERRYDINGKERILDALTIITNENKFNDVKDYLVSLKWDGVKRVDTLLTDYLGVLDNPYTRAVIRKALIAACGRAIQGATKFDNMPIIVGRQGLGKSTFLRTLGGPWFSDSLTTFEGKEAAELLQGVWIIEIQELQALNRSETNAVKQFLSKVDDDFRPAYGRVRVRHPRRCVFFGTTNDTGFLKDQTGNRRFWPVNGGAITPIKSVWNDLPGEVDQIWAEAYKMYILGEDTTYMDKDLEAMAEEAQEAHRDRSEWEGMIEYFLQQPIPEDWYTKTRDEMRRIYQFGAPTDSVARTKVCSAEIWELCLGGDAKNLNNGVSAKINQIVRNTPGWVERRTYFGPYGRCRGFEKKK